MLDKNFKMWAFKICSILNKRIQAEVDFQCLGNQIKSTRSLKNISARFHF